MLGPAGEARFACSRKELKCAPTWPAFKIRATSIARLQPGAAGRPNQFELATGACPAQRTRTSDEDERRATRRQRQLRHFDPMT